MHRLLSGVLLATISAALFVLGLRSARASAAPAFVSVRGVSARLITAMPRQAATKGSAGQGKAPASRKKAAAAAGSGGPPTTTAAGAGAAAGRRRKRAAATADDGEGAASQGGRRAKAVKAAAAKEIVVPVAPAAGALLFTLPPLLRAEVVNRPSKVVKSPYLADIKVLDDDTDANAGKGKRKGAADEETHMAHTPSLGCGNLVTAGALALVAKSASKTAKSKYVLHHVLQREADGSEHTIGTHPQTAEKLALALLEGGFALGPVAAVVREVTMGNSRFDFVCTHADGSTTVVECKNVPIADYCDGTKKERAAIMAAPNAPSDPYGKLAIFPEGYRKKVDDPVSPRALKHIQELQAIAEQRDPKRRAMLLFVTQRTDVRALCITSTDAQYRAACQEAAAKGVQLKAFAVRWDGNRAYLHKELPFVWD